MFFESVTSWRPIDEFDRLVEHHGEEFLDQQFDVMVYSSMFHDYVTFRCCIWSPLKNDFYTVNGNQALSDHGRPIYWRESSGRYTSFYVSNEKSTGKVLLTE